MLPNIIVQIDTKSFYLPRNQMHQKAMILFIFTVVTVISPTVYGSLQITDQEYPLMHFTKLVSEVKFTAGRPLVIVLPLNEEESTNKGIGYLIEGLHSLRRWLLLVNNISYNMNTNMYTEIQQHDSYIMLISGPCEEWEGHIARYVQQLYELSVVNNMGNSWNPRAKFLVSVMSNCTHMENTKLSRVVLNELWLYEVMNVAVIFLKSNEHGCNDLQQNTTDSAQGTYVELHTWYPYETSDRCNPTEGTVPVKVFIERNLSDISRSDIFIGYFGKNFQGCRIKVYVREAPYLVNEPKRFL